MRAHHLSHALLIAALLAQWWWAPSAWLAFTLPLTVVTFVAVVTTLVVVPQGSCFVPTVSHGPRDRPRLALSFDDGPDPRWTPQVLDVLAAHGAKATFFVVGARAAAHPELIARLVAEGHELGCHTQRHRNTFHLRTARAMAAEIEEAQAVLRALGGAPARWFRPPQGIRAPQLAPALAQSTPPLRCVTWSARALDAFPTTDARILARLLPAVHAGAILTLHDGAGLGGSDDRAATVAALTPLLAHIDAQGLACVTLSNLFERTSG